MNIFIIFTFLANPFQWVLEQLTTAFAGVTPLAAIGPFGIAVIVLTVAIRALLFPVFGWQLRTSRRIQSEQRKVAPQLQELRKKYKGQPQKLSAEMNKVYREHGISPFSGLTGCIPALVQMPVLIGLYQAIRAASTSHLLTNADKGFLWINDVSLSAQQACCQLNASGKYDVSVAANWSGLFTHPAVLILPLIAGLLTFAQSRMMMPPPRPDMSDQERTMANVTKQMSFLFPVMIFFFGLFFPQGLAIYWVTGSLFMVAQQFYVVGWGGLRVPPWWPGAHRVTPLSYPKAAPAAALVSANGSKNAKARDRGAGGKPAAEAASDDSRPPAQTPAAPGQPRSRPAARTPTLPGVRTPTRPSQRSRRRRRR
jgi:YidC/Oxa1 family membrane protein insertase